MLFALCLLPAAVFSQTAAGFGSALDFDGGDYMSVNDSPSLRPASAITLSAWIRPRARADYRFVLGKEDGGQGDYLLSLTADNRIHGRFNTVSAWHDYTTTTTVSLDQWHHVAVTYDGGNLKVYLDGNLIQTESWNEALNLGNMGAIYALNIGRRPDGAYGFNGAIDEVRIWSVARSQAQLQGDMAQELTGSEAGLAAYWKFDEGTGLAARDSTPNANHATLGSGSAQPAWVTSNINSPPVAAGFGGALDFDGGDYVSVNDSPSLRPASAITLSAWIRPRAALEAYQFVLGKEGGGGLDYLLSLTSANQIHGRFNTVSAWHDYTTTATMSLNQWHHVAVTYDGVKLSVYLDGNLIQTEKWNEPLRLVGTNVMTLGSRPDGVFRFNGAIDEVCIWSVARSQAQLQGDMAQELTGDETGLAAYWKFDEGTGLAAQDSTPNGNHATLGNGSAQPAWVDTRTTTGGVLSGLLRAADLDGDPLTYSIASNGSQGVAAIADASSGDFTYTPNADANGSDSFTYRVSDNRGGTATAAVSITINRPNRPPVAMDDALTIDEDTPATVDVKANDTDPDGDALTVTAVTQGAKGSVAIEPDGTLTYTPNANLNGSDSFTYTLSDGRGGTATAAVAVSIAPVNDPPVASAGPPQTVSEGAAVTLDGTGSRDPDGNALSYGWTQTGGPGVELSGANTASPTFAAPQVAADATLTFQLTVTDNATPPLSASVTVAITVRDVNHPPVLSAPGTQTVDEGQTLTFDVTATDPDGQALTLIAANSPPGATFVDHHDNTGTFAWTPGYSQAGTYAVGFVASDGKLNASQSVTIAVHNVNRPPTVNVPGAQTVDTGKLLTFTVTATDPYLQPLQITAAPLPGGASFDGTTFSWKPTYAQAGSYAVSFTATDGSLSDSKSVAITVKAVAAEVAVGAVPQLNWYWDRLHSRWIPWVQNGGRTEIRDGVSKGFALRAPVYYQNAYYNSVRGETRPAIGDLDNDGLGEVVLGAGPGSYGNLEIFSGGTHRGWASIPWPYYNSYNGETRPAMGDLDGDGKAEIAAGLGRGGAGYLAVFGKRWLQIPWSYYDFYNGETRPATGDLDGDGRAEIAVGLGRGGAGYLAVFGSAAEGYKFKQWLQVPWPVYNSANGETRPAMGDLDGDGRAEIVVGLGKEAGPWLAVFGPTPTGYGFKRWLYAPNDSWPAVGDLDGDGRAEILCGVQNSSAIAVFRGGTLQFDRWVSTAQPNPLPAIGNLVP